MLIVASAQKPKKRVRPTRAQTRARLLKAAGEVFAERGYDRASLDDVAAAAGLTKGAVYSSFASKDELFYALMRERIGERLDLVAEAAERQPTVGDITRDAAAPWPSSSQAKPTGTCCSSSSGRELSATRTSARSSHASDDPRARLIARVLQERAAEAKSTFPHPPSNSPSPCSRSPTASPSSTSPTQIPSRLRPSA